ncbi:MAG: bifunctional YncE family protein/alkaline phosphatase family protein [Gemmataceae bacterium]
MPRSLLAACFLTAACGGLALGLRPQRGAVAPPRVATPPRVLPGLQPAGEVLLPNQWSLRPAGKQLALGDFPVNLAVHPGGDYLAVLHAGYGPHEVVLVDLTRDKERVTCRVPVEQAFTGLAWSPDGKTLFASGGEFEVVHAFSFDDGLLGKARRLEVAPGKEKFIVGGLATDAEGQTLYVAGTWGHAVRIVPVADPKGVRSVALEKDSYPYTCLPAKDGKRLFVSRWAGGGVAVIDLAAAKVTATWPTERHPTEMALSPDGKTLYVACANSTKVSVLDADTGKPLETIHCALHPGSPSGNTPSSLCLTPDGQVLIVANSDANNLSLFNVASRGKAKPLGYIPVGWYPTSVRFNPKDRRIYVANGKGITSRANPQGPGPYRRPELMTLYQYIGAILQGTLGIVPMPTPDQMAEHSKQAYACCPLKRDFSPRTGGWTEGNPVPRKQGDASPIKHCLYIIKENRTYDQVLGDMKEGNGDPSLCLFPEKVTPNHHRLARQFVLLDNFYVEGEVSADGHEWSMGAYATDFVEKVWPLSYRGSPLKKLSFYPSEGAFDYVARPAGGYLWDRAREAGVTYRSYGEWIANGKKNADGTFEDSRASVKALEGHFDPKFRGYDLDYPDVKRAARFIEELKRFEKEGQFPQLTILRLPNDHTSGTKEGKPTPTAMVADNDYALGMVVEAVSKSKFWKDTAIFVLEDDAQNGPDHVDCHRSVALVISPWTRRNSVDSTMYSTSSMLRTMELILNLKPMSQFDAAARPMYRSFATKPDLTPYTHVKPDVDMSATNKKDAWGAAMSAAFDLDKEDAADDLLFNEVIWRSVKGANSPMPAPVRAGFFLGKWEVN